MAETKKTESFTIQIPEGMLDAIKFVAGLYDMDENDYVLHALQIAMIADGLPPVHPVEEDKNNGNCTWLGRTYSRDDFYAVCKYIEGRRIGDNQRERMKNLGDEIASSWAKANQVLFGQGMFDLHPSILGPFLDEAMQNWLEFIEAENKRERLDLKYGAKLLASRDNPEKAKRIQAKYDKESSTIKKISPLPFVEYQRMKKIKNKMEQNIEHVKMEMWKAHTRGEPEEAVRMAKDWNKRPKPKYLNNIIIYSEGNNVEYLKKARKFYGGKNKGKIEIRRGEIEKKSSFTQLRTIFDFLHGIFRPSTGNVAFVIWDCDVSLEELLEKRSRDCDQVVAYQLPKNEENSKVTRGIENMFPEYFFDGCHIHKGKLTNPAEKRAIQKRIIKEGTKEDFCKFAPLFEEIESKINGDDA